MKSDRREQAGGLDSADPERLVVFVSRDMTVLCKAEGVKRNGATSMRSAEGAPRRSKGDRDG